MKKFFSVKEVAKLLGVSTNTVYKYINDSEIAFKRIGRGRIKIPYREIAPFLPQDKTLESASYFTTNPVKKTKDIQSHRKSESVNALPSPALDSQTISKGKKDIVFYRLFKGVFMLGLGVIYLVIGKPYFSSVGVVDEGLGQLLFSFLPFALIFAGLFCLIGVFFEKRLKGWEVWTHVLQSLVLGYLCYIALTSKNFGVLIFISSLLILIVNHFVRGFGVYQPEINLRSQFNRYFLLLAVIGGVVVVSHPEFFPFEFISKFIFDNRGIAAFIWFTLFVPVLVYELSPSGGKSKFGNLWHIFYGTIALIIASQLTISSFWDISYISFLTGIFAIFLGFWQILDIEIDKQKFSLAAFSFLWISLSIISGLFAISNYQKRVRKNVETDLENKLHLAVNTIEASFNNQKSVLTYFATREEMKEVLAQKDGDGAVNLAKAAYEKVAGAYRVIIYDKEGVAIGAYPRNNLIEGTNISSRDYFYVTKNELKGYVSNVFQGVDGTYLVNQTEPVFTSNTFGGMIAVSLSLDKLASLYQGQIGPNFEIHAIDTNGTYVLSSNEQEIAQEVRVEDLVSDPKPNGKIVETISTKTANWEVYLGTSFTPFFEEVSYINIIVSTIVVLNCLFSMIAGMSLASKKKSTLGSEGKVLTGLGGQQVASSI